MLIIKFMKLCSYTQKKKIQFKCTENIGKRVKSEKNQGPLLSSCHWSLSIPPENLWFLMFSGGIERYQWYKMSQSKFYQKQPLYREIIIYEKYSNLSILKPDF